MRYTKNMNTLSRNSIFFCTALCLFGMGLGCSSGIQARLALEPAAIKIAVLDFAQEGFLGGEKLGSFAADELTQAFFVERKFAVVERAQIKAALLAANFTTAAIATREVAALGTTWDADYLILGKLTRLNTADFDPERNKSLALQISFRVIAVRDGAVIGVVSQREESSVPPRKFIGDVIRAMAHAVKLSTGANGKERAEAKK